MAEISVGEFHIIAERALFRAGAAPAAVASLIRATLSAERAGRPEVGIAHLPDYIAGLRGGRIAGAAEPRFDRPLPAFIRGDADGGIAQLGFDRIFGELTEIAGRFGVAVFTQANSFTAGELGYYVRRLAEAGLISVAATNAHAMMATEPGVKPVFSTNPFAFGSPLPAGQVPLVIDQASSATAFVNIARAAGENLSIPEGWALDDADMPTTSAAEAVAGALLPFGGYKGANIALAVELLSAGLAGANWSMDAGHFRSGDRTPGVGLTVLAIRPPDAEAFAQRVAAFRARLEGLGVRLPGSRALSGDYADADTVTIETDVLKQLTS